SAPSTAGTYTVVAHFAGSTDYVSADSTPVTFTITQATPAVAASVVGGTFTGNPFPASGTVTGVSGTPGPPLGTGGLTFTYYVGSGVSGTNLGASAPSAAGTYTVVAHFTGSADYVSADSPPVTFTINQATPTLTVMDTGGTFTGSPFPATYTLNGVT